MIQQTTRLVPTVNGWLHLGHLMMALVNQTEARRSGGKFIVRFDDSQRAWNYMYTPAELETFKEGMKTDLGWCGINPDIWSSQSQLMPEVLQLAKFLHYDIPADTYGDLEPIEVVGYSMAFYPANERLTAEHVLMDHIEHINCVIRGFDLITETNAYKILANRLGLWRSRHVLLPRLDFPGDVVSKTQGNYKLKDYRAAGIDPVEDLIPRLALDCLVDSFAPWTVENIKPRPVLGKWAKEMLCHS